MEFEERDFNRPHRQARSSINDKEAEQFLRDLATDSELRDRFEQNPRGVLLEYRIDVPAESLPETIRLPSEDEIEQFLQQHLSLGTSHGVLGFAILYWVLGAMPLVVAEGDGAA
jgi:hypothetical protein